MSFALAPALVSVLLLAGCDRLFYLDRLPEPPKDAVIPVDGPVDAPVGGDGGDANVLPGCPAGFTFSVQTQTYHLVVGEPAPWDSARSTCRNIVTSNGWHSHLVVINNETEYGYVFSLPNVQTVTPWTGAYDSDTSDGSYTYRYVTVQTPTHLKWAPNQPDMADLQNCARLAVPEGMDDEYCNLSKWFVCECDRYQDN